MTPLGMSKSTMYYLYFTQKCSNDVSKTPIGLRKLGSNKIEPIMVMQILCILAKTKLKLNASVYLLLLPQKNANPPSVTKASYKIKFSSALGLLGHHIAEN